MQRHALKRVHCYSEPVLMDEDACMCRRDDEVELAQDLGTVHSRGHGGRWMCEQLIVSVAGTMMEMAILRVGIVVSSSNFYGAKTS